MTNNIDDIADDGKNLAKRLAGGLVGLAGVGSGIALAMTNVGSSLAKKLLSKVGLDSPLMAEGIALMIVVVSLMGIISMRGIVKNDFIKMGFNFVSVTLGTYLIVRVLVTVYGIATGKIELNM